jgi:alpha-tubulin suppressor-like RCC1 family protein
LRLNALRREEVKEVSVGLYHVIVATKAEKVFAWGDGKFGKVGRPGGENEEVL